MGSSSIDCLSHDLQTKADAIHWHTAWIHTFEVIGDSESARELTVVLTEEHTHQQALQQGLDRLIEQRARGVTC
jgi:bacterioferritin (cytochrome b1)